MKKPTLWERYLTKEIGIEFKACLYFFAILFFYCCYRLCNGLFVAEILHMAEMIFLTYVIGYVQVFLLWNFNEAETLGGREIFGIAICTIIYTGVSFACKWFDRNIWVTLGFAVSNLQMNNILLCAIELIVGVCVYGVLFCCYMKDDIQYLKSLIGCH